MTLNRHKRRAFRFDGHGHPILLGFLPSDSITLGVLWPGLGRTCSGTDRPEVFLKSEKGQIIGLAIVVAEPKELTIVNIVGSIRPEDIRDLGGHFGIPKIEVEHK